MTVIYILLIVSVLINLMFFLKFANPDGSMTVDISDPENVKIDMTGVPVLDKDQKFFLLKVCKFKTKLS